MAHYTSKYKSYGFYVGDKQYKFSNGEFTTEDKDVILRLADLQDVVKTPEQKPATKPKTTTKKEA